MGGDKDAGEDGTGDVGEDGVDADSINESRESEGVWRTPPGGDEGLVADGSDMEMEGMGADKDGGGGAGLDPSCCIDVLLCNPDPDPTCPAACTAPPYTGFVRGMGPDVYSRWGTVAERDTPGPDPYPTPAPMAGGGVTTTGTGPVCMPGLAPTLAPDTSVVDIPRCSNSIDMALELSSARRKGFMMDELWL